MTDAELKIADAHYLNQQYPEAITEFKEFQSLHPNDENIPLVVFRLGQAYFDQFTSTDREQKNTEIAKGYFETVIKNYPKSPYAAQATEKLAKCIESIYPSTISTLPTSIFNRKNIPRHATVSRRSCVNTTAHQQPRKAFST